MGRLVTPPSAEPMPPSLDEAFDALVCRPLGRRLARALVRTTVTANQITGLAAVSGGFAGCAFAGRGLWPVAGALAMLLMMVLDCADGELARQRGGGGWKGRVLDGLSDLVTATAIHLGMLVQVIRLAPRPWGHELSPGAAFLIALGAGVSMAWRCGVVDDIKQRLKPSSVDRELEAHAGEARTPWDRFLYWTLVSYVRGIRVYGGKRRPGGYTCFRRAQWVGPTHHHLAMAIAALAVGYAPGAYLTFFVASLVPANLYLLLVLRMAPGLVEQAEPARRCVSGVGSS